VLLQQLAIALAVSIAAGYVLWSFLPMQRRQWLLELLAARGIAKRAAAAHRRRLATPGCGNCPATGEQARQPHRPT
jgi:hypothetical protein